MCVFLFWPSDVRSGSARAFWGLGLRGYGDPGRWCVRGISRSALEVAGLEREEENNNSSSSNNNKNNNKNKNKNNNNKNNNNNQNENQNENQIQNYNKKKKINNNNKQQQQEKEEEQQRQEQEQEQEQEQQQQQQQQQPQQQEQRQPQQRQAQAQAHRQQPQGAAKPLFLGRAPPADGWGRRIYIYIYIWILKEGFKGFKASLLPNVAFWNQKKISRKAPGRWPKDMLLGRQGHREGARQVAKGQAARPPRAPGRV